LPNGYFGLYAIAYVPAIWFRVMDKRLLDAVDRDPSRINFEPAKRDRLMRQYGLGDAQDASVGVGVAA
jgi:alkane 1-monooxygenase